MTVSQWNDPRHTWKLASYQLPERRKQPSDRRDEPKRATTGDRRQTEKRTIKSLLRL